jgi:integrase
MTRHETNFEPSIVLVCDGALPGELIPPSLRDQAVVPNAVSASRMIGAVIYGRPDEAYLAPAGMFILEALKKIANPMHAGPEAGDAKLDLRHHKPGRTGKKTPPMIVIKEGSKYAASTGVRAVPGQDWRTNPIAVAKLANYRYRKAIGELNTVCAPAITIADIVDEWTADFEPKSAAMKELSGKRYGQMSDAGKHIVRLIGNYTYAGPIKHIGIEYSNERTTEPRGNCSPDNPDPGTVKVETARAEMKCLRQMIRYHCEKHNKTVKLVDLPKEERRGLRFINWYQFMQFLLACRGWQFDLEGNLLRDPVIQADGRTKWVPRRLSRKECEQFEMVERFAQLCWYGLRHSKALKMRWGFGDWGYFDFVNHLVNRSAQTSVIHNKRAFPSRMVSSLERAARGWKRKDDVRGYKHVINNADGSPRKASMQNPFIRVAQLAGLPWLRPHHLKHSAVTLMAYAGMPVPALVESFSTSYRTLMKDYTHLQSFWMLGSIRAWKPENVGLKALKASSPEPAGYPRVGGRLPQV